MSKNEVLTSENEQSTDTSEDEQIGIYELNNSSIIILCIYQMIFINIIRVVWLSSKRNWKVEESEQIAQRACKLLNFSNISIALQSIYMYE